MLSVDLADKPVAIGEYQSLEFSNLPRVILGFEVKNELDEKRLVIKPEFNPQKIVHYCQTDELEPVFLYGVELNVTKTYSDLLETLNTFCGSAANCKTVDEYIKRYQNLLEDHGLTCDECYRCLRDGLYPIDLKHLPDLAVNIKNLPVDDLASMLEIKKEQWYLHIGAFHIFALAACGAYYDF